MKKLTVLCTIPIKMNNGSYKFKEGLRYEVAYNHPHLVGVFGEGGYKENFSKREKDLNLPYIWDYFYDIDKDSLEGKSNTDKLM